jgi:KDO2-lipid IV(A) lauroyltransferase
VSFFGHPAMASSLPAVLARRLDMPLIAGRIARTGGAHFRLDAVSIPLARTDDPTADIAAATTAVSAQFEAWIRDTPGQWMWAHRKWRDPVPATS